MDIYVYVMFVLVYVPSTPSCTLRGMIPVKRVKKHVNHGTIVCC